MRGLAAEVGAHSEIVHLAIDEVEQRRRVSARFHASPRTSFAISHEALDIWRGTFEEPDDLELSDAEVSVPPPPFRTWAEWAAEHWPSVSEPRSGDET